MNSYALLLIITLVVSLSIITTGSDAQNSTVNVSSDSLSRLQRDLFHNYNPWVIPLTGSGPVTVKLQIGFRRLLDYNKDTHEATIQAWVQMRWTDHRLMWNAEAYGNAGHFSYPSKRLWTPDITTYNHNGKLESEVPDYVVIDNSGQAIWFPQWTIRPICQEHYPNITCSLKFSSWTHNGYELDLQEVDGLGISLSEYTSSPKWRLVETSSKRTILHYSCCPEQYPHIQMNIVFQNRDYSSLNSVFQNLMPSWN